MGVINCLTTMLAGAPRAASAKGDHSIRHVGHIGAPAGDPANRGRPDHRGVSSDQTIALQVTPRERMLEVRPAEGAAWSVPTGPTSPARRHPSACGVLLPRRPD